MLQPVPVTVPHIPTIPTQPIPEPVVSPTPTPEPSLGFLTCPIQARDAVGAPVTSRTASISAVIDHSGTAIDPTSTKRWGRNAKDQKVIAFNGEVGDGEPCAEPPLGYTKKVPARFFAHKEINYVGAHGAGDAYAPTFYLNYDGHAGYDFAYPRMTAVLATASGVIHKATNAEDGVYGQGWDIHHTFYIKHQNSYSTWYRHCIKLTDAIEAQMAANPAHTSDVVQGQIVGYVGDFGAPGAVHLHLEVRNPEGAIVDPYGDKLWSD